LRIGPVASANPLNVDELSQTHPKNLERKIMIQKNEATTEESSSDCPLPAIDLAVPESLQTATFALG